MITKNRWNFLRLPYDVSLPRCISTNSKQDSIWPTENGMSHDDFEFKVNRHSSNANSDHCQRRHTASRIALHVQHDDRILLVNSQSEHADSTGWKHIGPRLLPPENHWGVREHLHNQNKSWRLSLPGKYIRATHCQAAEALPSSSRCVERAY